MIIFFFFIAVSQKSTLLFQWFVNEIGACWYGQMQTCPPHLPTHTSLSLSASVSLSLALSLSVCLSLRLPHHHHHPPTHRHQPPQPPTAPSPTLFNVVEGLHFYVLLFQVVRACMHARACLCVYIAGGGPLCVPLQISRSKRGKHGYINKCSCLTAPVAGTCHSGGISATDLGWVEGRLSWVKIPTGKCRAAASAARPNDDKGSAGKSHFWRPPVNVDAGRFASSHWHFASLTIPEQFSSEVACTPRRYSSQHWALAAKAKLLFFFSPCVGMHTVDCRYRNLILASTSSVLCLWSGLKEGDLISGNPYHGRRQIISDRFQDRFEKLWVGFLWEREGGRGHRMVFFFFF